MATSIITNIVVGVSVEKLNLSDEILGWFLDGEILFSGKDFEHPVIGISINNDCDAPVNGNVNILLQLPKNTEQLIVDKKVTFIKMLKEDVEEYPIDLPNNFWSYIESTEFSIFVHSYLS